MVDSWKEVENAGHQKMEQGETIDKEYRYIATKEDQTNFTNNQSKLPVDPESNKTMPSLKSQVRQEYFSMAIILDLFPL